MNPEVMSIFETTIVLTLCLAVFVGFVVGVYKVGMWCWRRSYELRARRFITRFDTHESDLGDALFNAKLVEGEGKVRPRSYGVRGWRRVRRDNITELAFGLADEAFLFFGTRTRSRANDLITRRWLRDQFVQSDSMRAKDKSRVIEIALALSYVAPPEAVDMNELTRSSAYQERVEVNDSYDQ